MPYKPWSTSTLSLDSREIMRGMCPCGHTAGLPDQANRPLAVEPGFLDRGRASVSQDVCEDLAQARCLAGSYQVIGKVSATQRLVRKRAPIPIEINRQPERSQAINDSIESAGSASFGAHSMAPTSRRVVIADKIPEDVNLATILLGG